MTFFANPMYLWLLALIPIIAAFYFLAKKKKKSAAMKFSSLAAIKEASRGKHRWRKDITFYLAIATILFIILALADLHIPLKQTKQGVNVVLVLDVSGSMQATDYKPSRIDAAKMSAKVLLESLQPNDYVGIVIFESGATTAAYLSPAKDKVIDKLMSIAPKQGRTAIGDGLALGIDMATSIPNKKNVVILLSDGVNNAGVISPAEAIGFAKTSKVQVSTIGMGTGGQTILGYDFFGNPQYAELDEATLQSIAKETGGEYYKSVDSETLEDIYSRIGKELKREKEETSIKDWLIAAAALIILAELYIKYGRYRIITE